MANDRFGIKKLVPSSVDKPNSRELSLPMTKSELDQTTISNFTEFDEDLLTVIDQDGETILYYELDDNDKVRFHFITPHAPSSGNCDASFEKMATRGYNENEDEWKQIEMTGHFFVKEFSEDDNYVIFKGPSGHHHSNQVCCVGASYGAHCFWDNNGVDENKVRMFKEQWHVNYDQGDKEDQNVATLYQSWYGFKYLNYQKQNGSKLEVHLEHHLSPDDQQLENWERVNKVIDFEGFGWGDQGGKCDGTESQPIIWGNYRATMRWDGAEVIRFKNLSVREIDPEGSFGDDTGTGDDPTGDPGSGNGDGNNPPPDTDPPPVPEVFDIFLTLKRELVNNSKCQCDGSDTPSGGSGGGGGGDPGQGGGGSGVMDQIYFVSSSKAETAKLASENNDRTFFLRFGQEVTQADSVFVDKKIVRVEFRIAEKDKPRGGTGDGVHVRIRKGIDDSIVTTLGTIDEDDIHDKGNTYDVEDMSNSYAMQVGDKILWEYDGGSDSDYVKLFMKSNQAGTGSKVVVQDNTQDPGEYRNLNRDVSMRVWAVT